MTLVELLVAIVIVALLAGVVYSTFRTVSIVSGGQRQRAEETHAAAAALDQLQNDLMRMFVPGQDAACALVLTQNLEQAVIAFCMLEPKPDEADLRWARLRRLNYRVKDGQLQRVARGVTGPESVAGIETGRLVEAVAAFRVSIYDGADWFERCPTANTNARPRAARLEIGTKDQKSWKTEIWIPAGTVFTSSIQRTATTAPTP